MKPSGTLSRTNSAAISPKRSGPLRPTPLDRQGATLDPAEFAQSLNKGGDPCTPGRRRSRSKEPNDRHLRWLLRARRERPRRRHAEQGDEGAPQHHSITSSAMARSEGGTERPSIVAIWALMISSNLLDCTTGKSAGFAPLRMRPA